MAKVEETPTTPQPLPKLSPAEFRIYNSMADHMDLFDEELIGRQHNRFRQTWNTLYTAASRGKRPEGMSIKQFVSGGLQFCEHLHLHHSIEEMHIFPVLAKKMPAFQKEQELLTQHKQIHAGLDQFQAYLEACVNGERELRMSELKALMDRFGSVLWTHLHDEVEQLGAEHMRQYWTPAEMKSMPM
ncbi:MAG: hypothetical protein Q9192_000578 [Flavoplaca navasiana]